MYKSAFFLKSGVSPPYFQPVSSFKMSKGSSYCIPRSRAISKERNFIHYFLCLFAFERIRAGELAKMILDMKDLFILSVWPVAHIDRINLHSFKARKADGFDLGASAGIFDSLEANTRPLPCRSHLIRLGMRPN